LKDRIGGQILEVELVTGATRDEALAVLRGVGCGDPEPEDRADRLTMPAPRDGLELVEKSAEALRHVGIGVSSLALRGPTLDDVFLQLTGAPASVDGDQARTSATTAHPMDGRPPPRPGAESQRPARPLLRLHVPTP